MRRALVFGLVLLGCGKPSDKPPCDSTLCSGCCDAVGQCQNGTRQTACGAAGNVCQICRSGEVCQNGACVDGEAAFDRCLGISCAAPLACDRFDGICKCGGVKCLSTESCDPSTKKCVANACGQASCAGCCENDVCQPGVFSTRCGLNGSACKACGAGQSCQAGACGLAVTDAGFCNRFNCSGCCLGINCFPGFESFACGSNGSQCNQCQGASQCIGNQCQFVAFDSSFACNPGNCSGCCVGNVCVSGTSATACGQFGQTCSQCMFGAQCQAGQCGFGQDAGACNSLTCAGCCAGGFCFPGQANQQCGSGGTGCFTCMPGTVCDPFGNTCRFPFDGGVDAGGFPPDGG